METLATHVYADKYFRNLLIAYDCRGIDLPVF